MEKEIELITDKKEDYTSMEKYVLSKLEIAEEKIANLTNENEVLKARLTQDSHKMTVAEFKDLQIKFIKFCKEEEEKYYKEHGEYLNRYDMMTDFVVWLEAGGFEIYVR